MTSEETVLCREYIFQGGKSRKRNSEIENCLVLDIWTFALGEAHPDASILSFAHRAIIYFTASSYISSNPDTSHWDTFVLITFPVSLNVSYSLFVVVLNIS